MIVDENSDRKPNILDIGTGSGCIAISLALEIPDSRVTSLDVSSGALDIADKNASWLGAKIELIELDILESEIPIKNLDILVSNPPYVLEKEKELMNGNVLDFDPHLALFVPDNNPLIFYKAILAKSLNSLNSGGKIYFEINEAYGKEVSILLEDFRFSNPKIVKDLNGKDRFVTATKS